MTSFASLFHGGPSDKLLTMWGVTFYYMAPGATSGTAVTAIFNEDQFMEGEYADGTQLERHATLYIKTTDLTQVILDVIHTYRFYRTDGSITKSYGVKAVNRTDAWVEIQIVEIKDKRIHGEASRFNRH
jgi:hypothetical protein